MAAKTDKQVTPDFPWVSAALLLLPIAAAIYLAATTSVNIVVVLGYGIANLSYLLVGVGIFTGKFGIFKITNRKQAFIAAAIAFVAGTALVNVNF